MGYFETKSVVMHENEITQIVVATAFDIHSKLGPGLFESVYETIMEHVLVNKYHLQVVRQFPIPVIWNSRKMELGFRADLLVENKVLVELKSLETIAPVHYKQVLTYLRLSHLKLGLLINFNEALIKTGIKRVINGHIEN
jgi:GxxExxY protein